MTSGTTTSEVGSHAKNHFLVKCVVFVVSSF